MVTLNDMLTAREDRVKRQNELLSKYHCPIVCYTMNIAGPTKKDALIERAFFSGLNQVKQQFADNTVFYEYFLKETGCEAMFCVNLAAEKLKKVCLKIEECAPIGRLFDMDVIDKDGTRLHRNTQRCCLVCKKSGSSCASRRLHSVNELQFATKSIIKEYFKEQDSIYFANLAKQALIDEVSATPKPGLVDLNNSGSHSDMNKDLFIKSANALQNYFSECVTIGQNTQDCDYGYTFDLLRKAGIKAEEKMYSVTNNINTHKGAIFTIGIICGSIGRNWSAEAPFLSVNKVLDDCALIGEYAMEDFNKNLPKTAGLELYKTLGLTGVRGEVYSGLKNVKNIGLPTYKQALCNGLSANDAAVVTLLNLMATVNDSVVYKRGGKELLDFAKKAVTDLLSMNPYPNCSDIKKLDEIFISKNISHGGCADLLAATILLYNAEKRNA